MNLQATKKYFEDMFSSYWTNTDIHFAGQEFDGSKRNSWINPIYKPLRNTSNGVSSTTSIEMGQLYIVCWADTDNEVMGLAASVIEFIDVNVETPLFRSRGHDMIDHGWDDSNKVFVMLSFTSSISSGAFSAY